MKDYFPDLEDFKFQVEKEKVKRKRKKEEVKKIKPPLEGLKGDSAYFSQVFDKKDLQFFEKVKAKWSSQGVPDSPDLNEYCFLATINRRLHYLYEQKRKILGEETDPELVQLLNKITENSTKLAKLSDTLVKHSQLFRGGKDIVGFFREMIDEAKDYIKKHAAEIPFKAPDGTIIDSRGLHFWGIYQKENPQKIKEYFVFSEELYHLVRKKYIPLWVMAFALRTSVQGLMWTFTKMGLDKPEVDLAKEEEMLKQVQKEMENE